MKMLQMFLPLLTAASHHLANNLTLKWKKKIIGHVKFFKRKANGSCCLNLNLFYTNFALNMTVTLSTLVTPPQVTLHTTYCDNSILSLFLMV